MSVVRKSAYRHVFGTPNKRDKCYQGIRITKKSVESSLLSGNAHFLSVLWESAGGGAFLVLPHSAYGKIDVSKAPLIRGHKKAVLDTMFHPFNHNIVTSGSEDMTAKLWQIPAGGVPEGGMSECVKTLTGHRHKIVRLSYHPSADNVLATASQDKTVRIWDVSSGDSKYTIKGYKNVIQSVSWKSDGSAFASSSKDKNLRITDPRTGEHSQEVNAHTGAKGFHAVWLGSKDRVATVGFSRSAEREIAIWDVSNLTEPLTRWELDTSSGAMMPFYDEDTGVLFVGGKGDGNIRYYELVDHKPWQWWLSDFKSTTPQKGLYMLPKYACNIMECEMARFLKLDSKGTIEPISMTVPRKSSGIFQEDIYPPTRGWEAAITSEAFFGGENAEPKRLNLEEGVNLPGAGEGGKLEVTASVEEQLAAAKLRIKELEDELAALKG